MKEKNKKYNPKKCQPKIQRKKAENKRQKIKQKKNMFKERKQIMEEKNERFSLDI